MPIGKVWSIMGCNYAQKYAKCAQTVHITQTCKKYNIMSMAYTKSLKMCVNVLNQFRNRAKSCENVCIVVATN